MGWFVDSQTTNRDYLIWDDPKTINYDKSTLAQAALVAGVSDDKAAKLPLQTSIDRDWVMFLIYSEQEAPDVATTSTPSGQGAVKGNMWTREGILAIRDLEAPIRSSPEFQKYCLADSDVRIPTSPRKRVAPTYTDIKCARHSFRSPLDLLYFSGFLPNDLETITQEELDGALKAAIENPNTWENFKILFDAEVSVENLKVKYIRT